MGRKCDSTVAYCPVLAHVHRKYKKIKEKGLSNYWRGIGKVLFQRKMMINAVIGGNSLGARILKAVEKTYRGYKAGSSEV
jgi:hypothetical protein